MSTEQGDSRSLPSDGPGPVVRPKIAGGSVAPRSYGREGGLGIPSRQGRGLSAVPSMRDDPVPPSDYSLESREAAATSRTPQANSEQAPRSGKAPLTVVHENSRTTDKVQTGEGSADLPGRNDESTGQVETEKPGRAFTVDSKGTVDTGEGRPVWGDMMRYVSDLEQAGDEEAPDMRRHVLRQIIDSGASEAGDEVQVVGVWNTPMDGEISAEPSFSGKGLSVPPKAKYTIYAITEGEDGRLVSLQDTRHNVAGFSSPQTDSEGVAALRRMDNSILEWWHASPVSDSERLRGKFFDNQDDVEGSDDPPGEARQITPDELKLYLRRVANAFNPASYAKDVQVPEEGVSDAVRIHTNAMGDPTSVEVHGLEDNFVERLHDQTTPVQITLSEQTQKLPIDHICDKDKERVSSLAEKHNWIRNDDEVVDPQGESKYIGHGSAGIPKSIFSSDQERGEPIEGGSGRQFQLLVFPGEMILKATDYGDARFEATVDDGTLSFNVNALDPDGSHHPDIFPGKLLEESLSYFGRQGEDVHTLAGAWFKSTDDKPSVNYDQYMAYLTRLDKPMGEITDEDRVAAAQSTWTGIFATAHGYRDVHVDDTPDPKRKGKADVRVRFARPRDPQDR